MSDKEEMVPRELLDEALVQLGKLAAEKEQLQESANEAHVLCEFLQGRLDAVASYMDRDEYHAARAIVERVRSRVVG